MIDRKTSPAHYFFVQADREHRDIHERIKLTWRNTISDVDWGSAFDPTPITPANTINMMSWVGQHIDQLRDRVLSVVMGRIMLLVSVNQPFGLTGIEGKIQVSLYHCNLSLFKRLISDTVTTAG